MRRAIHYFLQQMRDLLKLLPVIRKENRRPSSDFLPIRRNDAYDFSHFASPPCSSGWLP